MLTLLVMGCLLVFTATLIPRLGRRVHARARGGKSLDQGNPAHGRSRSRWPLEWPRGLREVIASVPEIKGVMSQIGRPDDGTDVTSFFNLEFNVPLRPMEEWRPGMTREKIEDELAAKFKEFDGVNFNFSQLIRDNVDEALSGVKGANSIKLIRKRPEKARGECPAGGNDPQDRSRESRTSGCSTSSASPT